MRKALFKKLAVVQSAALAAAGAQAQSTAATDAVAAITSTQGDLLTILGAMLALGIAIWGIKKIMRYFR